MTEVSGNIDSPTAPEPVTSSRLVIEIGPGVNPRIVSPGEKYIGIESRTDFTRLQNQGVVAIEDPIITARARLIASGARDLEPEVRSGDARETGLEDGSADEVYASNVFGSLLHPTKDDVDAADLIKEGVRILNKDSGVFRIVENVTPANRERLEALMTEAGLTQINKGREDSEVDILRFNERGLNHNPSAYMLEYFFPDVSDSKPV